MSLRVLLTLIVTCSAAEASAGDRAHFLFELRGTPVGTVTLSLDEGRGEYQYTSVHLFTREGHGQARRRSKSFRVDEALRDRNGGVLLESLWLWRGPRHPGCVRVREELGSREGELCVDAVQAARMQGSLMGERFEARLDPRTRRLVALEVGAARFTVMQPTDGVPAPPDLFAQPVTLAEARKWKVEVTRAARATTPWPSDAEAARLGREVHRSFVRQEPSGADFEASEAADAASCLGHVRRFLARAAKQGRTAAIVHGLVAREGERTASPHVWLRVRLASGGTVDVDPTWDIPVTSRTHVPLIVVGPEEKGAAGRAWMKVLLRQAR